MSDYTAFAENERRGWSDGEVVQNYVTKFGPVTDEAGRQLAAGLGGGPSDVLDLCCGHGTVTAMLAARGHRVTGIDFSEDMLARAARAAPQADLRHADAAALPFADATFDAVLCNFGMMHLPDQPAALSEVSRVLRPGGIFTMATWSAPQDSPAFGTVFGAIRALADMSMATPQPDLFAFADRDTAHGMLADAGLALTEHRMILPVWRVGQADGLFDIFNTGTVAAKMTFARQSPEVVARIRGRIAEAVREKFAAREGYEIPVAVTLLTARRDA